MVAAIAVYFWGYSNGLDKGAELKRLRAAEENVGLKVRVIPIDGDLRWPRKMP